MSTGKFSVFIFFSVHRCHFSLSMKHSIPSVCETVNCSTNWCPYLCIKSHWYERNQYSISLHILGLKFNFQNSAALMVFPILKKEKKKWFSSVISNCSRERKKKKTTLNSAKWRLNTTQTLCRKSVKWLGVFPVLVSLLLLSLHNSSCSWDAFCSGIWQLPFRDSLCTLISLTFCQNQ